MNYTYWLQKIIAEETGLSVNEISGDKEFESYHLDSLSMVSIAFELETLVKHEVHPTVFSEYNTINKLSEWLAENHK